jgi:hypothetical protein
MKKLPLKKGIFGLVILLILGSIAEQAAASVILKILATNPSQNHTRQIPVKVYLPKEAKPEDIIDKADLQVGYDAQQGSYYVFGTYEAAPLEVIEKDIELKDVWMVDKTELVSIRDEAQKIKELLANTEFAERGAFLADSIIGKIDEIEQRQGDTATNPEEHISAYRYNLQLLEEAKADLAVTRSMLSKERRFSRELIWKLILYIVIFLGVLSGSFYFIWHKQVNVLVSQKEAKSRAEEELGKKEEESEETPASDEDDIEKMLGGE